MLHVRGTNDCGLHSERIAERRPMGARLMAIVTEGDRSRIYMEPTPQHEATPTTVQASLETRD